MGDTRPYVSASMLALNESAPHKAVNLVLFDDALRHLLRVARIIGSPKGHAILLGSCTLIHESVCVCANPSTPLLRTYVVGSYLDTYSLSFVASVGISQCVFTKLLVFCLCPIFWGCVLRCRVLVHACRRWWQWKAIPNKACCPSV